MHRAARTLIIVMNLSIPLSTLAADPSPPGSQAKPDAPADVPEWAWQYTEGLKAWREIIYYYNARKLKHGNPSAKQKPVSSKAKSIPVRAYGNRGVMGA